MTDKEFERRITRTKTATMAVKCLYCGFIDEVNALFSDGMRCPSCGKAAAPIGYLKPVQLRKKPTQYEAHEQEKLFNWAGFVMNQYPELKLLYHCPNGGSRNKIEAANMKRQGVKPGVPDLCLPVARGKYHGLYIEMKARDNKPSEIQKKWLLELKNQGYAVAVCYDWESASRFITNYLSFKGKPYGNPRLCLDDLKNRNKPVWVGGSGKFYALCQNGTIIPPSGRPLEAQRCLASGWEFYDHEPEEEIQ